MNNQHTIGIDIGTHNINIVICEDTQQQEPRILHALESPSRGFRHGYIADPEKAFESLSQAIRKAEREYKQKITHARFTLGGIGLESHYIKTSITIQKKNSDIDERSIQELLQKAEDLFVERFNNKKILHIIPVKYRVDDYDVLGTPTGMYGSTIEVRVIFVTIPEHHYDAFVNLIERTKIQIDDIQAGPLADAQSATTYRQRTQGCILVNIGSETTALSVFENGIMTSLELIPLGSNDITNDLALGLKISLEEAEKVKTSNKHEYPKRSVEEIIQARIIDILELTGTHLVNLKKHRLLPAGIIFSGGGSATDHLEDLARNELLLPAQSVNFSMMSRKTKRNVRIPNSFSSAYGICFNTEETTHQSKSKISFGGIKKTLNNFFKQIMP